MESTYTTQVMHACKSTILTMAVSKNWGYDATGSLANIEREPFLRSILALYMPYSMFDREAKEPWFLVTNLSYLSVKQAVVLYKKKMWTEMMFGDLKNRNWGLGLNEVRLSEAGIHDQHFLVVMLCYLFLVAFGAAAESQGLGEQFKTNTRTERFMVLERLGNYAMQIIQAPLSMALDQLKKMPE